MADVSSLHKEMVELVQRKDLSGYRELLHSDYTYTGGDGVEQQGADAGVAVAEAYTTAFPDIRLEVVNQFAEGNRSVIEFRATGTHEAELEGIAATGKKISVVVCNIIEEQDGKIVREREYFDQYSFMQQLGVIPTEG